MLEVFPGFILNYANFQVNGEDILGLRISDIAHLVKARTDCVTLLLWSTGNDPSCDPDVSFPIYVYLIKFTIT